MEKLWRIGAWEELLGSSLVEPAELAGGVPSTVG